ncbi:extracellular solute-binding protein [Paenibacillus sp. MER TA 81-3]|uniref:ABC transporter substrate-binding protein n=1 Tax=Paenibacillus sp. MER TA 81-3 TaxID=2939573 RepID=UPI002040D2D8|nr:extracellular solute-binding protein [Paenibacillus sp. MER TA 81-3]MCM3337898.1 extracellular solute-binding protein [Paenibacillus sp. MER TA 81-3]
MRKKWKVAILLLTVISLLGGCFAEKPALEELGQEGKGKIKVLYYDEGSFYSDYGNNFNVKYPNIEFEVINTDQIYQDMQENGTTYEEEYLKFIGKHKPDVIMTGSDSFERLAQEGKLYNLDPVIEQEKFDLDGYMPGLIDMLRERGGGSLYGLAPYFNASVVYYNADLFREHHIEPPRNKMSWKELLELSSRFSGLGSGDDQIYGLSDELGQADGMLFNVASSSSLRLLDAKGEKVTFKTDGWKNAMELTANAIRGKAVYTASLEPEKEGTMYFLQSEQFFKGKVAMMFGSAWLMSDLRNRPKYDSDIKEINWEFVTAPVDTAAPEESSFTVLDSIYAIAADSQNKRAAWEFVKFVNGPEMAKAASRSFRGQLPTRVDYMKEMDGKSMEPFYMLRPKASGGSIWGGSNVNVPNGFRMAFSNLLIKELKAMVENGKSAEEAVAAIETEGNTALQQAREAAKMKQQAGKK